MFNYSNKFKILKNKNITIKRNNILRIVNIGSNSYRAKAIFLNTIISCNIGINGSIYNKKEGDKKTPKGIYFPNKLYYRYDKIKVIKTYLKKEIIKKDDSWCDDVKSYNYNKIMHDSIDKKSETMWRNDNLYDLIISTSYNQLPILKHKGSAIFLHINNDIKKGSLGCITFKDSDLRRILANLNNRTLIHIK